tara:strand:+ start:1336 stop:2640 length:1305 start_codon:yes stop_codon:yes gene_type:complete
MKVDVVQAGNSLEFKFGIEKDDKITPSEKFRMGSKKCEFILPDNVTIDSIHPDHLALVSIMLSFPFIGKKLSFPFPVSKRFHKSTEVITKFSTGPVDIELEPFASPEVSNPGLALSGGVDSIAALAIMPKNTVSFFLDRPIRKRSLYDKDAAHKTCKELLKLGYDVFSIETDLEYIRNPVGFPVDVANSSPAVLLAKSLSIDSIAFGTIMESAYGIGHSKYRHYPEGSHFSLWGSLFEGAGIPLNQVVAGMSEVSTSKITIDHPLGKLAQSCIRGKWKKPCLNCWKCFRKVLLEASIKSEKLLDEEIDKMFKIPEARINLCKFPIKHENILTYITSKYQGRNSNMKLLRKRVRGDLLSLDWLEKWNPESESLIYHKYRNEIIGNIKKLLRVMDENEVKTMKSWDMSDMLNDSKFIKLDELMNKEFSKKFRLSFD